LPLSSPQCICVLRFVGMEIGEGTLVMNRVTFTKHNSRIGPDSFVGNRCYFEDNAPVIIGAHVWIASHCRFLTASHDIETGPRRAGRWWCKPIVIGDGCWLGDGVIVLPGVTIGRRTVVAAGSVVTRDCEPDCLYAGVPAVRKRRLPH